MHAACSEALFFPHACKEFFFWGPAVPWAVMIGTATWHRQSAQMGARGKELQPLTSDLQVGYRRPWISE